MTITARIYSPEKLTDHAKAALSDGLDIVGQYTGRISVVGHSTVKLPSNTYGEVNPHKVGYKGFDKAVDIHLFMARISFGRGVAGLGYRSTGVAWIESRTATNKTPLVAAHEVSHALGFLVPDAPQAIKNDVGHCATKTCIMTPKIETSAFGFGDILPTDFCLPCKADMRDVAEENISEIHYARRVLGTVTNLCYV